jgi:hypothetical protein
VAGQSLDDSTHFEIPNNYLGIFSSTGDKSIALADVDICDEIKVSVQTRLQS